MSNLPRQHHYEIYAVPCIPQISPLMLKEPVCDYLKYGFECVNNGEQRINRVQHLVSPCTRFPICIVILGQSQGVKENDEEHEILEPLPVDKPDYPLANQRLGVKAVNGIPSIRFHSAMEVKKYCSLQKLQFVGSLAVELGL
ncbi:hypothetical protein FGO68_gene11665 [Halteria grandinella]|uniref:Uncharacterized protein n=1 Tax=Halteria grandinella TaxID=5974 RepID=A0A8J8SUI8_HALGN|nr:hypothetical protein FGO68_gene11665 [Halteria grandinella]